MLKPLCKFCRAHHDTDEGHPEAAVREALAELRRTEPGSGQKPGHEPTELVTKSVVTKATVTKGRPRIEHPSAEALRRQAYRERKP